MNLDPDRSPLGRRLADRPDDVLDDAQRVPREARNGDVTNRLQIVTPSLFSGHGGIARIARATVFACAGIADARGWQLDVLSLGDDEQSGDRRYLPGRARYKGFCGSRIGLGIRTIRGAQTAGHVGTIFCHVNLASLGLLFPRTSTLRSSYAVVAHGVDVWGKLPWHRRQALRRADEIWPVSEFTAAALRQVHGIPTTSIRVIHNCLDPFWEGGATAPPAIPFVLSVCRMAIADRYKGVDDLIVAFSQANGAIERMELLLVGDGEDRGRLEEVARHTRASDRIRFLGAVDDSRLGDLYRQCDIFALPSAKEGFGLVYLEAMAAAKPVVAARAGAAPEVVLDGSTGLLVSYGDRSSLTSALESLGSSPELRAQMGAAGLLRLREHFTVDRYKLKVAQAIDFIWAR